MNEENLLQVQVHLKSTGTSQVLTGDMHYYTGDYVILVTKEVVGDKLLQIDKAIPLGAIEKIIGTRVAEKRELLTESNEVKEEVPPAKDETDNDENPSRDAV